MSNPIIRVKIDVSKVDKTRLFKGTKGTYLDVTLLPNREGADQYGNNYMVIQDVSKEERQAGTKGPILGNAKIVEFKGQGAAPQRPRPAAPPPAAKTEEDPDSIPF